MGSVWEPSSQRYPGVSHQSNQASRSISKRSRLRRLRPGGQLSRSRRRVWMRSLNLWASRKMNGSRSSRNYAERVAELAIENLREQLAKQVLVDGCPKV